MSTKKGRSFFATPSPQGITKNKSQFLAYSPTPSSPISWPGLVFESEVYGIPHYIRPAIQSRIHAFSHLIQDIISNRFLRYAHLFGALNDILFGQDEDDILMVNIYSSSPSGTVCPSNFRLFIHFLFRHRLTVLRCLPVALQI